MRSLEFGELGYGETRSLSVRVHQNGAAAPELERVEVDLQAVRTEVIRKTKAPPHLWEVTVTLDGNDVTHPLEFPLRLVRGDG